MEDGAETAPLPTLKKASSTLEARPEERVYVLLQFTRNWTGTPFASPNTRIGDVPADAPLKRVQATKSPTIRDENGRTMRPPGELSA